MCVSGKVAHMTMGSAEYHADQLEGLRGVRPAIYTCTQCSGYHVGYSNNQRKKMSRKQRRKYNSAKNRKRKHKKGRRIVH